ncbi:MAG: C40 family peptidase [Ignavibacteriales bacterium]|nr:C40 family peptidase [Ignavibacteriales bacterium]
MDEQTGRISAGTAQTFMTLPENLLSPLQYIIIVVCSAVLLTGCTASSPRFRINENTSANPSGEKSFAKESEEEIKENDRAVDVENTLSAIDREPVVNPAMNQQKMMEEIRAMIGTPYAFSGTDEKGIDCSGFTARIYSSAMARQLPHSTAGQYEVTAPVAENKRMFGDLLFFNTTGEIPSHVGIYLGEDLFAHASVSQGVTISSLESSYYKKRYLGARRVAL